MAASMSTVEKPGLRGVLRAPARRTAAGLVLLLLGILLLALWRVVGHSEHLPWSPDATPSSSARVTSGKQYSLAVPGGVRTLVADGVVERTSASGDVPALSCQWRSGSAASSPLSISTELIATKAENTVASFDAPVTGTITVTCTRVGVMYVPDADNRTGDVAGFFLLASVIVLTAGGALSMSGLRAGRLTVAAPSSD